MLSMQMRQKAALSATLNGKLVEVAPAVKVLQGTTESALGMLPTYKPLPNVCMTVLRQILVMQAWQKAALSATLTRESLKVAPAAGLLQGSIDSAKGMISTCKLLSKTCMTV